MYVMYALVSYAIMLSIVCDSVIPLMRLPLALYII